MFHTHNPKNEKYKYGIVGTAPLSVGVKWDHNNSKKN